MDQTFVIQSSSASLMLEVVGEQLSHIARVGVLALNMWGCDKGHRAQDAVCLFGSRKSRPVMVLQDSNPVASARHCVGTTGQA